MEFKFMFTHIYICEPIRIVLLHIQVSYLIFFVALHSFYLTSHSLYSFVVDRMSKWKELDHNKIWKQDEIEAKRHLIVIFFFVPRVHLIISICTNIVVTHLHSFMSMSSGHSTFYCEFYQKKKKSRNRSCVVS